MSGISKKPKRKAVLSEQDVDALINKGGGVPKEPSLAQPKTKKLKKTKAGKIPVQLRLSQELLDVIDGLIDERVVTISRHAWFLEAIADKIKKERNLT